VRTRLIDPFLSLFFGPTFPPFFHQDLLAVLVVVTLGSSPFLLCGSIWISLTPIMHIACPSDALTAFTAFAPALLFAEAGLPIESLVVLISLPLCFLRAGLGAVLLVTGMTNVRREKPAADTTSPSQARVPPQALSNREKNSLLARVDPLADS
jgi:hypothetical protein